MLSLRFLLRKGALAVHTSYNTHEHSRQKKVNDFIKTISHVFIPGGQFTNLDEVPLDFKKLN